jgi:hypothetical protein
LEDHGKIPLEILKNAATLATTGMAAVNIQCMQCAKHLYKCLLISISMKVQDSLNPYLKQIKQDGPLYFKYIMMEVTSNPSPEAEAHDICQTLLCANLLKELKKVKNYVKSFNLHGHAQLTKLASYTTNPKEDLQAVIMATYRAIPCRTF